VPMAEAVVFAMLTSYVLSRTLVPTLAKYWLRTKEQEHAAAATATPNAFQRMQRRFEARFEDFRDWYHHWLGVVLGHGRAFVGVFLGAVLLSLLLYPLLGRNFFPEVDSGQIKLHLRAPTGIRVEQTAALVDHVEAAVREAIPAAELASIVDNVGLPVSGINLTYGNSGTIGTSDADVLITLTRGHEPTAEYVRRLRERLPQQFPGMTFAFLPADIVSQILNFGLPSPIDLQIVGPSPKNRDIANHLLEQMKHIPGLVDLRIQQTFNQPELHVST